MRFLQFPALLFFACCLFSCGTKDGTGFVPSPYVLKIVSEKSSYGNLILSSYTDPDSNGDIAVAGSLERCLSFRQTLISSDLHDNVSGNITSDGLPDFSGEKISAFCSFFDGIRGDTLIAAEIGQYLCALDTVYHLSPYDMVGLGHKNRAKLLVLADPSFYVTAKGDIDFLNRSFGSSIPVVFPLEETIRRCLSSIRKDTVSIGFISDSSSDSPEVYEHILEEVASESGKLVGTCFTSTLSCRSDRPLTALLDEYISEGDTGSLDAVIIDSYVPDMTEYVDAIFSVRSVLSPESLLYGKYISEDFFILGVYDATADCCYHIMRDRNLFTHNIAFPYSEFFCITAHPDSTKHTVISVPYVI